MRFSPDGKLLTFLKGKEEDYRQLDLWSCDVKTGEERLLVDSAIMGKTEDLSEEEAARRERKRVFSHGITEYVWAKDGQHLAFPINGQVYHCDQRSGEPFLACVTEAADYATDVSYSPGSRYLSYVSGQNLYLHELSSGERRQVTFDGCGPIKNGMAEYIAQEEMDRYTGYWWSDDDKYIAYLKVDESPVSPRYELSSNGTRVQQHNYPFAGTANVTVRLMLLNVLSGESKELDLGTDDDIYIARVDWEADVQSFIIQRQDREQKVLDLIRYDCVTETYTLLHQESADDWVNLNNDFRSLKQQESFLWASERSGYKHLYLYSNDGSSFQQLTDGPWAVNKVLGVDEDEGYVYFDGFYTHPLQKHVYRVSLDSPGGLEHITQAEGWHDLHFNSDFSHFIDQYSHSTLPPQLSLCKRDGTRLRFLEENRLDASHPYHRFLKTHVSPEFGVVHAEDGTRLHYKMIKPFAFDPLARYPVIVRIYGGPHTRKVKEQWDSGDAWSQIMANRGFVVFTLDNRGSSDRGKVFEAPIYKQLGEVELRDQLKGVEHLKSLDFVDPERIGMFGWSYGGYMTLMALLKEPEIFKAGVSVAPVTDWELYDTHYTERYLDLPKNNPEGYRASSVFEYLGGLKGDLLLVHGDADDNVLYANTRNLAKALQDRSLPFRLMTYPGQKHSIAKRSHRVHLFRAITDFFVETLGEKGAR
jgi:dipeptidyl-peptidase-4